MLTSLFYYGYYKPYIVKEADSARPVKARPRISADFNSAGTSNKSILLNKAFKVDVVDYATNIYKKVIRFKDAAKYVSQNIDGFEENVNEEGFHGAKEWLSEDIEEFVNAYNAVREFAVSQEHSPRLREFAYEQEDFISFNRNTLNRLGITIGEDGVLSFSKESVSRANNDDLMSNISEAGYIFGITYQNSVGLLRFPIANHMNFRNLGYYYNYKMGTVQDDTFKIIESGMIVNFAI